MPKAVHSETRRGRKRAVKSKMPVTWSTNKMEKEAQNMRRRCQPECGHQDAKKEAREIYTLGQRLVLVQISQNFGKPGVDDNDHTTGLGGRSKRPRMWDKT